jgi:hypothetical protein
MPRQKSLITVIRELVHDEVRTRDGLLGTREAREKWPPASSPRHRTSAGFQEQSSARLVAAPDRLPLLARSRRMNSYLSLMFQTLYTITVRPVQSGR